MSIFFKKFSFWMKVKGLIALFGVGGEVTLIATDQHAKWHIVTMFATAIGYAIANFIEDKNNNGIVDAFESNKSDEPTKETKD